MESDMPFHNFGHQPVQRATASSHQLQDSSAFLFRIERPFNGVHLSSNPSNAFQKFFFVFSCVSHILIIL